MVKSLACRAGRHEWTTQVEKGQTFTLCGLCGKEPRTPKGDKTVRGPSFDDVTFIALDKPWGGKTQGDRM